ncbi:quaternary amine ABC transporter ATP-binding protein [Falsirhodobacter sp. 20TX0035]|uniref:quaternary amine ABC transporter ATP-binding protein n=1 Tax=Falsirhodobacter sp. 20TX0035 TaxID=3022019 RepID=UPI00232FA981|nr:glycine betaine/L-proline ABC transporter ATP-binding protein [Falsirhodobacter sp. 20TX0035]MDB6454254.1 glycine betaine/L-proline ABC transporter ATP-binding protein [Falsirhodobacter sp. 20TX0035]
MTNAMKFFGDRTSEALERLSLGEGKAEIYEATGVTVGVHDVNFEVEQGEIFVIMGLSGSGKSTLVRMLNGLVPPTSGKIRIDGTDIASCTPDVLRDVRRRKIAMVFQHFALFPHRTILENVAYGLKVKGIGTNERLTKARAALEQVGLGAQADSFPAQLSGGMQQRVGIARGLATDAEIILMDEPFGALDPLIRREMQEELLELQRKLRKTIVFITHDLNEAMLLGNRIAIMKDGRFVQVGTPQEIVAQPADDYVAAFMADIDRGRVFTAGDVAQPAVIVNAGSAPATALAQLDRADADAVHVIGAGGLEGVATYRDIARAVRDDGALSDAVQNDMPVTGPDTPLHQLYEAASSGLPVAVTDGEGRLTGVVEPKVVLAHLSGVVPEPEPEKPAA